MPPRSTPTADTRSSVLGPAARGAERTPAGVAAATAIGVVIALVALVGVGLLVMRAVRPHETARKVTVPSVKGLSLTAAQAEIERAGLTLGRVSYVENEAAPEGTVIEQLPAMGEAVAPSTAVNLTLCRGKQTVTVPNVGQRTVAEATERLEKEGLHLGEIQKIFHESVPAGLVVRQGIAAGTKVEGGTAIDLTVSKGPEPAAPPPATATATPSGEPAAADDPMVQIREDESFHSDKPNERRLIVQIAAMGTAMGQRIQVLKSDDTGREVPVVTATMDPGSSKEWPIKVVGNATIEVYHNDRNVFSAPYKVGTP